MEYPQNSRLFRHERILYWVFGVRTESEESVSSWPLLSAICYCLTDHDIGSLILWNIKKKKSQFQPLAWDSSGELHHWTHMLSVESQKLCTLGLTWVSDSACLSTWRFRCHLLSTLLAWNLSPQICKILHTPCLTFNKTLLKDIVPKDSSIKVNSKYMKSCIC